MPYRPGSGYTHAIVSSCSAHPRQWTGHLFLLWGAWCGFALSGGLVEASSPPEGRPLFYWGGRGAAIVVPKSERHETEAALEEVHVALDKGAMILRLAFDRDVGSAVSLPDGRPVSGRLRAVLNVDADGNRKTGADMPGDPRMGADYRIELGVIAMGRDPDEDLPARALVTVAASALLPDGRRRAVWHADSDDSVAVSIHGPFVEFRIPLAGPARLHWRPSHPLGRARTPRRRIHRPVTAAQRKILVIDDEPEIRAVVRGVLEAGGYLVVDTGDPVEALDLAKRECPRSGAV